MKEDGAFRFRLSCMLLFYSIPFRREICSMEKPDGFTRSFEGDWRYLCENGHEHISLMPFLLFNNHPFGGLGWRSATDEDIRLHRKGGGRKVFLL